jgi:hypothetical protein
MRLREACRGACHALCWPRVGGECGQGKESACAGPGASDGDGRGHADPEARGHHALPL